jgi:hypothetical protein
MYITVRQDYTNRTSTLIRGQERPFFERKKPILKPDFPSLGVWNGQENKFTLLSLYDAQNLLYNKAMHSDS